MHKFLETLEKLASWKVLILVFAGSLILYGNTLWNDYALDDAIVITQNGFTKQGVDGISKILTTDSFTGFFGTQKNLVSGGRYRPLSVVSFAMEYQLYGAKPAMSHLWNILFYALTVFLCYWVVSHLLKNQSPQLAKSIATISAFLFLLHPLHTEVVANIKGRDELFSVLFSLVAFAGAIRFANTQNWKWLPLSAISLFLALLSKENALAFVFIIPFALFFFSISSKKQHLPLLLSLLIPALVFVIIRQKVLGGFATAVGTELMNNPFLEASTGQKYATILYTWFIYLKLLFFPHPLTFDYYPYHIPLVEFDHPGVWLLILILLIFFILVLKGFKSRSLISFSIIGFAAAFVMVSNLFFPVGTFMNERFLFMPSLFWSLAMAGILITTPTTKKAFNPLKVGMLLFAIYILGFFSTKTITRNKAWKDDLTLFTTDVATSVNSAKSNCSAGGKLWEYGKTLTDNSEQQKAFQLSEQYLAKAVAIHPTYADAWLLLGNVKFDYQKQVETSVQCFLKVMQWQPANENAWKNLDIVLQNTTDRPMQLSYYEKAYALNPNNYTLNYRLGVLYGRYFSNLNKSIGYLEKATQLDPSKVEALKDLGTAYGMSGNIPKAYETFKHALALDTTDTQVYNNLVVSCMQLGLKNEAQEYIRKMERLKINK
ncbi:MAG: hypothetical protein A2W95_04375 [Bacteroidetes bacterium GWA2_40_14]|nr:MAG: hypothetical protein A2W95_04375 [Bacteroidetes bacterium GWA2_40_14]